MGTGTLLSGQVEAIEGISGNDAAAFKDNDDFGLLPELRKCGLLDEDYQREDFRSSLELPPLPV